MGDRRTGPLAKNKTTGRFDARVTADGFDNEIEEDFRIDARIISRSNLSKGSGKFIRVRVGAPQLHLRNRNAGSNRSGPRWRHPGASGDPDPGDRLAGHSTCHSDRQGIGDPTNPAHTATPAHAPTHCSIHSSRLRRSTNLLPRFLSAPRFT